MSIQNPFGKIFESALRPLADLELELSDAIFELARARLELDKATFAAESQIPGADVEQAAARDAVTTAQSRFDELKAAVAAAKQKDSVQI